MQEFIVSCNSPKDKEVKPFNVLSLFFDYIQTHDTAFDIINRFAEPRDKGNIYEKLWDIIIKTDSCDVFSNKDYIHMTGNNNNCKLGPVNDLYRLWETSKVLSKNEGGSSDITLQKNDVTWIFISCKYYIDDSKKSITDYDVESIRSVILEHGYVYKNTEIYLIVKDKVKVEALIKASQKTNDHVSENIAGILDLNDLNKGFNSLKSKIMNIKPFELNDMFCNRKISLKLRFHQDLLAHKTIKCIEDGEKQILWGWKCRAGKTYGIGCLLLKYSQKYGSVNALIMTPAPTETLPQFTDEMFHLFRDFNNFNISEIKSGDQLKLLKIHQKNNIIIASKQLLDDYINEKKIQTIVNMKLDLIIGDENHFGGTTSKSKDIIDSYAVSKTVKVFLTATYQKPLDAWNIPIHCRFFWDIEDEQFCKQRSISKLVNKHGKDVSQFINDKNKEELLAVYDNMPDMHLITTSMDHERYHVIKNNIMDSKYGFSMEVLFSLCSTKKEFNYPSEVTQILRYISGSKKELDFKSGDKSIFTRIKNISNRQGSRTTLSNDNFTTQLWFLPFGKEMNIDNVSECLKSKIMADDILKRFQVLIINSKKEYKLKDLKHEILLQEIKAQQEGKSGLILLAGNQCSLGITLPLVDIVFLLTNTISADRVIQMMYRSMSETVDGSKKVGFVVDLNISRVLNTLIEYHKPLFWI